MKCCATDQIILKLLALLRNHPSKLMNSGLGKLLGYKIPLWRYLEEVKEWIVFELPTYKIQISVIIRTSLHSQRRERLRKVSKTKWSATFFQCILLINWKQPITESLQHQINQVLMENILYRIIFFIEHSNSHTKKMWEKAQILVHWFKSYFYSMSSLVFDISFLVSPPG